MGNITLASDGTNLIGAWFDGQKYFQDTIKEKLYTNNNLAILNNTRIWLDKYFNGDKPQIRELLLLPDGSNFRQSVWKILCDIPYGDVITYGEIAKIIAKQHEIPKMSPQAVGNAVGHNPISIIIPCHRVVGSNGKLTGYAGGIDLKIKLLEHEKTTCKN